MVRRTRTSSLRPSLAGVLALGLAGGLGAGCRAGEDADAVAAEGELAPAVFHAMAPLNTIPVPRPVGGAIVDEAAAVRLGKAFFWDMQAGSDGQQACASCHFHGGADNRRFNAVHPGDDGVFESNGVTGPGQVARVANTSGDDRLGSQGVTWGTFEGVADDPSVAADVCSPRADASPFLGERRVTPRNSPTVVGAAFFRENFWDGRASHVFNGNDPFGLTSNAGEARSSAVENASLASQAVGPANDPVEMACEGRPFNGPGSLATKLLARPPLALQEISPTDGVLGAWSAWPGKGLRCGGRPCTYRELIEEAFGPTMAADAEAQFSRIWGEALQAYEATLIPDQTPLDRYLAGDMRALSASQQSGLLIFRMSAQCIACHAGPELSDATVSFANLNGLVNVDGGDQGFHNIGVRPVPSAESGDLGRASVGPSGASFSRSGSSVDRGAFKTPSLRNVKLTAPYFHDGSKATLRDVVVFYEKGGDFPHPSSQLNPIALTDRERDALVDFLENALTDCRVEREHAPFDHPSLAVPGGPSLPAVGRAGTGACPTGADASPSPFEEVPIPLL